LMEKTDCGEGVAEKEKCGAGAGGGEPWETPGELA
jgi:hypothetical protein